MGEGAGMLLLETAEHAARRGAKALAELRSVGLSTDAHHATAPHSDGDGAFRAMQAALRAGSLSVAQLDYINAHSTSTPTGDEIELKAICRLAEGREAGAAPLLVSSTKGATGHLLGAAGAVEAAFTVLALRHQQLPPTINLDAPCGPSSSAVAHVTLADAPAGRPIDSAICNSFGFGGMNGSVLFAACPEGGPAAAYEEGETPMHRAVGGGGIR